MCKKATKTSSKLVRNVSIYDETHRQTDFAGTYRSVQEYLQK